MTPGETGFDEIVRLNDELVSRYDVSIKDVNRVEEKPRILPVERGGKVITYRSQTEVLFHIDDGAKFKENRDYDPLAIGRTPEGLYPEFNQRIESGEGWFRRWDLLLIVGGFALQLVAVAFF